MTLLAVIGILNAIQHERNISYWMRAGGLALQTTISRDEAALEDWLQNPDLLRHWTGRGMDVLRDLGISPVPGPNPC
jgi:hypothetical protein